MRLCSALLALQWPENPIIRNARDGGPVADVPEEEITQLLKQWSNGDRPALDRLVRIVYPELRTIAARCLARERQGHTLQCTALVNEAYLRLVRQPEKDWQDRTHFFAVSARIIRGILVDYARARGRLKRSGNPVEITAPGMARNPAAANVDLLDLDSALDALHKLDPLQSRIVELRYFGGLSMDEVAVAVGVSTSTAKREWTTAKTWIRRHMEGTREA
jgi:RNA polymerase sigma-70 factor, ECF subfamily